MTTANTSIRRPASQTRIVYPLLRAGVLCATLAPLAAFVGGSLNHNETLLRDAG